MAELTPQVDAHIAASLASYGRISREMLASVEPSERGAVLYLYYLAHSGEQELRYEGMDLVAGAQPPSAAPEYPVFQRQSSLLDAPLEGQPVSRWMWLLPLGLGWVGGLIAWALTREDNRRMARAFVLSGVAVTILSLCMTGAAVSSLGAMLNSAAPPAVVLSQPSRWPAPTDGRPVLYYFGTST